MAMKIDSSGRPEARAIARAAGALGPSVIFSETISNDIVYKTGFPEIQGKTRLTEIGS